MKKFLQLVSLSALTLALALPVQANQGLVISPSVVQETVKQLEIMAGDANGNLNLSKQVTRAEFATMLVAASPYKSVSTGFGYTLFTDVPSSHWASGYVKVVVEKGYMVGYLDGTFGPSRTVLVEEAVTAALNLLGYNGNSLSGTYPQAQLAKFYELDMDEFMTVKSGQAMTREQCMYLFYNLMNTATLEGTPYASTLGYAVTANGALDTMALTNSTTQGPFIVGTATLPSELSGVNTIYKNNKLSSLDAMEHYDICYYNEKLNTVWIYDEKITGRVTQISSIQSPTAVTVAGKTYQLETVDVIHKFSVGGSFQEGDMVTLLLGNQGAVADVVSATQTDASYVGVVLDRGVDHFADGSDSTVLSNYIRLVSTDGVEHQFDSGKQEYEPGRVVSITYNEGQQVIRGLSTKSVTGKVNNDCTMIGKHKLAEDVEIFEISNTEYQKVYPSRLAGYTLKDEDVRYYTTNAKGEIDTLMLEDVTGDLTYYMLLTLVTEYNYSTTLLGQYTYQYMGEPGYWVNENKIFNVKRGAAIFHYEDGKLDDMENIESGTITSLSGTAGVIGKESYLLADTYQVYERMGDNYKATTLYAVNDLEKYNLTGYYDLDLYSAGDQIRIIVAELR